MVTRSINHHAGGYTPGFVRRSTFGAPDYLPDRFERYDSRIFGNGARLQLTSWCSAVSINTTLYRPTLRYHPVARSSPDPMNTPHLPALPSSFGPSDSRAVQIALDGAKRVLKRRFRVLLLVRDAYERMTEHARPMDGVREDLGVLLRLMKAWALQNYQHIPWTALLLITSAVMYFVMPVDLIPDALVGIGFVDDVAVVSTVVQAVRSELDRFRRWERTTLPPAR